jgi:tetratricopeptide (TPR) repeat protein
MTRSALLAILGATLAACSAAPPPPPVLTADPPVAEGPSAEDGAQQVELDRGAAFAQAGKHAEAKEHFRKAIALKPTATAWAYLGEACEKSGDRKGAEEAYQAALRIDPAFVGAAQNLGALLLDDPAGPRVDEAIAVLQPAAEKAKDNARLLQNLGYAYGLKDDMEAATRAYEAALAKGEDAQTRFDYGSLLFKKKQVERAAEQLRKAAAAAKDDAALLVSVGRLLGATKAFDDCVRAFDKAIAIKGTDPEWFVRRGTCKHELKNEDGARADYEQATKIDPKFAAGHYYLGLSALTQKKRQTAQTELEKAEKLGAGTPIGKAAHDKLEEMKKKK